MPSRFSGAVLALAYWASREKSSHQVFSQPDSQLSVYLPNVGGCLERNSGVFVGVPPTPLSNGRGNLRFYDKYLSIFGPSGFHHPS